MLITGCHIVLGYIAETRQADGAVVTQSGTVLCDPSGPVYRHSSIRKFQSPQGEEREGDSGLLLKRPSAAVITPLVFLIIL